MKRIPNILLAAIIAMLLSSCTVKYTSVTFNQEADTGGMTDLNLNANGSSLETDTDQTADGSLDLSEVVKAAKATKSLGILDKAAEVIGSGTEKEAVLSMVSPSSQIEEVE
ncbi:MAG TPA: hypothetical protein DCZ63_15250 [Geobacter sp.]|nr:hypothetical protein [Geobacter sp.]